MGLQSRLTEFEKSDPKAIQYGDNCVEVQRGSY